MTIRKGSSYRDRPPHDKTEATMQFERELDEETPELLPCPFCGGEARHYAPGPIDHHIECVECYADIHRDTEAEAIAAWNTRAELGSGTCRLDETASYSNANEIIHLLECSECGRTCEHVNGSYPRCPHCGAMVKEDGDDDTQGK